MKEEGKKKFKEEAKAVQQKIKMEEVSDVSMKDEEEKSTIIPASRILANLQCTQVDKNLVDAKDYEVMLCPMNNALSVYLECSDAAKNMNKFYVIQLLRQKVYDQYFIFTRYGKVGEIGKISNDKQIDLNAALSVYQKKYKEKIKKGYNEIMTPVVQMS